MAAAAFVVVDLHACLAAAAFVVDIHTGLAAAACLAATLPSATLCSVR